MKISVAVALRGRQEVIALDLEGEPSVAEAVAAARVPERFPEFDLASCRFALWGREVPAGRKLREGDRIELLRPLLADPKAARRERVARSRGKD
jgi:putative ubiquitin-RnfH superfamily antitoxin RatB of RatAB toxin-antitoxin module